MGHTIKIKDFIEELKKYPNQDAELNFIVNTTDSDTDIYDIEDCNVECWGQDKEDVDCYDIFVSKPNELHNDECITELLDTYGKLTIELNRDDDYSNIVVMDKDKNVLRDIQVGGRHYSHENIAIMLSKII
jgi:hypothetical protein